MRSRLLFAVDNVFEIPGRGVIVVPGLSCGDSDVRPGDEIDLRRPDGTVIRTRIAGVGMTTPNPTGTHAVLLASDVGKLDIPIGTEIWHAADDR